MNTGCSKYYFGPFKAYTIFLELKNLSPREKTNKTYPQKRATNECPFSPPTPLPPLLSLLSQIELIPLICGI